MIFKKIFGGKAAAGGDFVYLMQKGDYAGALVFVEKALKADPQNISLLVRKAECHERLGQTDPAVAALEKAVQLYTEDGFLARAIALQKKIAALKRGEVLFDVAKYKLRPFVVKVADTQVRAVGTSFTVSKLADHPVSVMVREGVIEINNPRSPYAVAVRAGSRAETQPDGRIVVASLTPVQVAHNLDWREGRIFFRHQTLASAAKELERYSTIRIVIADPAVASKTVTGMFVATDPVAFAKAASAVLDLKVGTTGKTLLLSQKHR